MEDWKCPVCGKNPIEPINLRCDHHPCFECASSILDVEDEAAPLEIKYRIFCPTCHKKTITYDLRHLIINHTEQDEDLFVTTKFISKKSQVQTRRSSINPTQKRSSQGLISICSSSRPINLECKKHQNSSIQYFCNECYIKNLPDAFLCNECFKVHPHKVSNVSDMVDKIESMNMRKREEILPLHKDYLENCLSLLLDKKDTINQEFEKIYKEVAEEFKILYQFINEQYESTKKEIRMLYSKQTEELKATIGFAQHLKEGLASIEKVDCHNCPDIETQVNYSICLAELEAALEASKFKLTEKFEIPIIIKRTFEILESNKKLFEISSNRSSKQISGSKLQQPMRTRIGNMNMESARNYRIEEGLFEGGISRESFCT